MANYEIMVIIDPKEDIKIAEKLAKDVFGNGLKKFTKMQNTKLAYPINNSMTAQYALIDANVSGELVKEFIRKVNITKTIWRQLAINLDTERAKDSWKNMKKFEEMKKKRLEEREARGDSKFSPRENFKSSREKKEAEDE